MNFACSPGSIATSHQSAEGADGCLCSSGAFKTCKTSKRLCYEAECLCVREIALVKDAFARQSFLISLPSLNQCRSWQIA